jgi:hypothetical protein
MVLVLVTGKQAFAQPIQLTKDGFFARSACGWDRGELSLHLLEGGEFLAHDFVELLGRLDLFVGLVVVDLFVRLELCVRGKEFNLPAFVQPITQSDPAPSRNRGSLFIREFGGTA